MTIFPTGASGYAGGRPLHRLEEEHRKVRYLTRRPNAFAGGLAPTSEIVAGDLLEPDSLVAVTRGVSVAYYFVHSMDAAAANFAGLDRRAAGNFASGRSIISPTGQPSR